MLIFPPLSFLLSFLQHVAAKGKDDDEPGGEEMQEREARYLLKMGLKKNKERNSWEQTMGRE